MLPPLGNTLWLVDDENAIADGVAIDANDVWGAWTLQGARLSAYPIGGNGTPDFEFSSFGSGNSGVASARGADRMAFMESNAPGNDFRVHGFRSTSGGTPGPVYHPGENSRAAIGKKGQEDRALAIRVVGDFDYRSFG